MKAFRISDGKGFQITHQGNTMSVQFGKSNYCEHHCLGFNAPEPGESDDAEIAFFGDGEFIRPPVDMYDGFEHDDVLGHVDSAGVLKGMAWLAEGCPGARPNYNWKEGESDD